MPLFRLLILLIMVLLIPSLGSADVSEGLRAYQANDVKTAFRHWRPAADQGDPDAQYWLGRLYEEGQGVPQDFEEAHMWYNLAAAQGNEEARKAREALAGKMTREELAAARERARGWRPVVPGKAPAAQAPAAPSPQEATEALIKAAEQGNAEATKMFLSAGANVNGRDAAGWTPLLRAAVGGHLVVAKILIEAGADVNAANPEGNTPLMGAALAGNRELVELLHQKAAKPDVKNQKGMTALTFAEQKSHAAVVEFLRSLSPITDIQGLLRAVKIKQDKASTLLEDVTIVSQEEITGLKPGKTEVAQRKRFLKRNKTRMETVYSTMPSSVLIAIDKTVWSTTGQGINQSQNTYFSGLRELFLNLEKAGLELRGSEVLNGRDCYVVSYVEPSSKVRKKQWIDKEWMTVMKGIYEFSGFTMTYVCSNFKPIVSDIMLAYLLEGTSIGSLTKRTTERVTSVHYNTGLSDDLFNPDLLKAPR